MIDFHTHSTASDGTDTPAQVVREAVKAGLSAVALTDHDTVSGLTEFLRAAEGLPITAVPGVEISTNLYNKEIHILGLFIDPVSAELLDFLENARRNRNDRNSLMLAKLNAIGYHITLEELQECAHGESIGRPHVAEVLVRKGYFPDVQAAFDSCLKRGARAYVPRSQAPPAECIRVIHAAGGLAFWAHPVYRGHGERASVRRFLKVLVPAGLDGIEAFYSQFTPYQTRMLGEMADEFHILRTGGTDYHGAVHPGVRIGSGCGELNVPDELFGIMLRKRTEAPCG
ncbi:MAG: PHP domain-containing protein [Lentisphaeria bacterium]|nr:PHP domain-containing protein [Lentisphaeria bacterium]